MATEHTVFGADSQAAKLYDEAQKIAPPPAVHKIPKTYKAPAKPTATLG